jgi:hypothetical protein
LTRSELIGLISCRIRSWGSPFRAFLLPRSRTPSPAPLPSCRFEVPSEPPSKTSSRPRAEARDPSPAPSSSLPEPLRLQGFAPRESPPLPLGCLRLRERVALLGFIPSRVFSLAGMARPSPRLPSWDCPLGRRIGLANAPSGSSYPARWARLSRDRLPSWGFPPHDPSRKFGRRAIRESPPQAPGCVAVPLPSSLWTVSPSYRSLP